MNKLQFWTLATEISDSYNMRGEMLTSTIVELRAVCAWAEETNASAERVKVEIEDTIAEARGSPKDCRRKEVI